MIGSTVFAGTLSLACSVQDVAPLLDQTHGAPKAVTLVIEDGRGEITGMDDLAVEKGLLAYRQKAAIRLVPIVANKPENQIWGEMRFNEAQGDYSLEWMMAETTGRKGQRRVYAWSRGRCTAQSNDGVAEGTIQ